MLPLNRITRQGSALRRSLSTLNIAIIGSGPSGFYTAVDLLKQTKLPIKVTIFEKLPVPFGLSRFGVAPDHPEVKNCEDTFNTITSNKNFKFVGNVEVGKDVSLSDLRRNFNGIVFAYGNSKENKLGIKGEDLPGVINAKEFVGWYNGNLETKHLNLKLNDVNTVTIIGNGNVAMDIARLLLMPPSLLSPTDITNHALKQLQQSKVSKVNIVARRGLLESAFATKEIRELLELEQYGVKFNGLDDDVLEYVKPMLSKLERVKKRKIETLIKFMTPIEERKTKYLKPKNFNKDWSLKYLKTPVEIIGNPTNPQLVSSIKFQSNRLVVDNISSPTVKIEPIPNSIVEFPTDLVIVSTGFKGTPIKGLEELGIKFDEKKGIISNINSKVINNNNEIIPGLYATGWIKNHSKGPIVNTLIDSNTVVESIINDFQGEKYPELKGVEGLRLDDDRIIDWTKWDKLNGFELKFGKLNNKTRWKIPDLGLMNEIITDGSKDDEKLIKYEEPLKRYQ